MHHALVLPLSPSLPPLSPSLYHTHSLSLIGHGYNPLTAILRTLGTNSV